MFSSYGHAHPMYTRIQGHKCTLCSRHIQMCTAMHAALYRYTLAMVWQAVLFFADVSYLRPMHQPICIINDAPGDRSVVAVVHCRTQNTIVPSYLRKDKCTEYTSNIEKRILSEFVTIMSFAWLKWHSVSIVGDFGNCKSSDAKCSQARIEWRMISFHSHVTSSIVSHTWRTLCVQFPSCARFDYSSWKIIVQWTSGAQCRYACMQCSSSKTIHRRRQ